MTAPMLLAEVVSVNTVAVAFSGGVLWYLARVVMDTREKITRIYTALFGAEGDNGINGTVKKMKAELDEIKQTVTKCQATHGFGGPNNANRS